MRRHPVALTIALIAFGVAGCGSHEKAKEQTTPTSSEKGNRAIVVTGNLARRRLGEYRYYHVSGSGGSYREAVAVFGQPSSRTAPGKGGNICSVGWSRIGLEMGFAGTATCAEKYLKATAWYGATISSRSWSTERGLHIGDSVRRLRQLYPRAHFFRTVRTAVPSWGLIWEGQGEEAGWRLIAEVRDSHVTAIVVPAGYIF